MSRAGHRDPLIDRGQAWSALVDLAHDRAEADREIVGERDLAELPAPARRLLDTAATGGRSDRSAVVLDMEGEIKLQRWMPFVAQQVLYPGRGFVWNATVGRPWLRFTGGDAYRDGQGSLEFRLFGLVPVVRAAGPDVARSAAGRLAAETVAWAPQALLPSAGVSWRPIDDDRAAVCQEFDGHVSDVTVTVDQQGRLRELVTMRWGTPPGEEFGLHPFGGSVTSVGVVGGRTVAVEGTVGWHWGTERQDEGQFFRYRIRGLHRPGAEG